MWWLLFVALAFAVPVDFYYGQGCPHCAFTEHSFNALPPSFKHNVSLTMKEVYFNDSNRAELVALWNTFNASVRGVPTLVFNRSLMVVGEFDVDKWKHLIALCSQRCPHAFITSNHVYELGVKGGGEADVSSGNGSALTLSAVVLAALADAINPCTLAIMAMLLGVVVLQKGRQAALISGLVFSGVVFVSYFLMGVGIINVVNFAALNKPFLFIMFVVSLIISVLELRAFFHYTAGFSSLEMPMFLRPVVKNVIKHATNPLTVAVVAFLCSLFLLPCSSGPYLVILTLISQHFFSYLPYLLLYNFIFISPMLLITVVVFFGIKSAEEVKALRDKYVRYMHLIAGVLMLGVAAILALRLGF